MFLCRYTDADIHRWGQATALINDVLLVHGGRTDEFNAYAYSSAPVNNDVLLLSLSDSFNLSDAPWDLVSGCSSCSSSQGPAVAWHTITPFDTANLLLFGGDAGPNGGVSNLTAPDSGAILDAANASDPSWTLETSSWANEPVRRIYHTSCTSGGKVFIVGGEKDDGSGNGFSEHYVFDPSGPSFTQLPSTNGPPDLYGHASVMLLDGRMLVFGGFSQSEDTLLPFSAVWSLDTTQSEYTWTSLDVSTTSLPTPRRGFAAAALDNGKVLIQGGANVDMQTVYGDGWILDTTQTPMTWTSIDILSQVGQRRDHFAVAAGTEVLIGFGASALVPLP